MYNAETLRNYLSLFDTFTGTDMETDEDWAWHVLLQYTQMGEHEEIVRALREFLDTTSEESFLDAYLDLGGGVSTIDAAGARRFLATTIELAPVAAEVKERAYRDDPSDDSWTRTPRPRLARENAR